MTDPARTAGPPGPRDPIAIIGLACRLPGAPNLDAFWDVLVAGADVVGETPRSRPAPARPGGFLDDIEGFDAGFFSISPREAVRLDPQLRLLLETTWEALEDAGLDAGRLRGTSTGVYTGCFPSGYWSTLAAAGMQDLYGALGAGPWQVPAGRISHFLDLRGPSMNIEATCAGSLLAVHLACRAIWSGEISQAIVGGANLLLSPELYPVLAESEVLSPSGRCRFGDAGADGYVRSEGIVSVILKPLRRAVSDGDRVYATIIGTSAMHAGRTGGAVFSPGQESQEAMLRAAYADAGGRAGAVGYVEAHGTGTEAGDRVELGALRRVLPEGRAAGSSCLVGSMKSNFGHAEGAAGLAGLVKGALAVYRRTVPATLHVTAPHPIVAGGADAPLELAVRTQPWPTWNEPAVAGVSAFGLSGTNTHIVLTEAAVPARTRRARRPGARAYVLPLAAPEPAALTQAAGALADLLERDRPADLRDVCFSAGDRRTHPGRRIAVVGDSRAELAAGLRSVAAGQPAPAVASGSRPRGQAPRVVFVFPGQGSQWSDMGRELMGCSPVFARRMRECARAVEAETGWSPARWLAGGGPLAGTDRIQPALWAIQVALAATWRDWGIEPDLVIGHSMGEIAAATAAGALTTRDAAAVVCRRSRLLAELPRTGAMWAVQLGEQAARAALGEHAGRVCVGVINSAHSTVLSGAAAALGEVVGELRRRGVFCRPVQVDYASHSPLVEDLRAELSAELAGLAPRPGAIPVYSTARDEVIDGTELGGAYWMDNLRQPVRFASAIESVLAGAPEPASGRDTLFVEISPHPVLCAAVEDLIGASGAPAAASIVPSLERDQPAMTTMLSGLAAAYVRGCAPDWGRVYPGARFAPLPHYPWQHKRFWADLPAPAAGPPAPEGEGYGVVPVPAAPASAVRRTGLASLPAGALLGCLRAWAGELLAMPPDEIAPDVPLTSCGLDSMLAARLHVKIGEELGLLVSTYDLLENRTPAELVTEWHRRLREEPVPLEA
jgi:acyl transferase domain-containing protein